jgi:ABC-type transport system involved in cytochrome bd biosynthesis fused ATPase/permease subunit
MPLRGEGSGPPKVIRTKRPEGLLGLVLRAGRPDADRSGPRAAGAGASEAATSGLAGGWPAALVWYAVTASGVSVGYTCLALAAVRLAQALVVHAPLTTVSGWSLFGVMAAGGRAAAAWYVARSETALGARVGVSLREEIAASLLAEGPGHADQGRVGAIVLAVRAIERACVAGVLGAFRASLMGLPLVVVLLTQLPRGAWLALVVFLPFTVGLGRVRRQVRARERRALERGAELDAHLDDLLRHIDLFRVHGTHSELRTATRTIGRESARATVGAAGVRSLASSANEVLASLAVGAFALAVASGGLAVDPARVAPALAVAFLLYRPIRDFGDARAAWLAGESALHLLSPLRNRPSQDREAPEPPPPPVELAPLRVRGFGAARTGQTCDFEVPAGGVAVLVGPVGSGKTTLFRALLGLEPSVGSIWFGDRAWEAAPAGARPFAWAPQDAPMVAGDLRRNLALGGPAVEESATLLARLAPGVGEALDRGAALSGGERALVAVARAVASGRPVLLLDEPAAHLDSSAQDRVIELMRALRGQRTLLVVSHQSRLADAILDRTRGDVLVQVHANGAVETSGAQGTD